MTLPLPIVISLQILLCTDLEWVRGPFISNLSKCAGINKQILLSWKHESFLLKVFEFMNSLLINYHANASEMICWSVIDLLIINIDGSATTANSLTREFSLKKVHPHTQGIIFQSRRSIVFPEHRCKWVRAQGRELKWKNQEKFTSSFACLKAATHFSTSSAVLHANCSEVTSRRFSI